MENKGSKKMDRLELLQQRRAKLTLLCKEKEGLIGKQVDHISENIGPIALHSLTGYKWNKEGSAKAEIVELLVSEGIDTAMIIHADPTNLKEKIIEFIKKVAAGIIHILTK